MVSDEFIRMPWSYYCVGFMMQFLFTMGARFSYYEELPEIEKEYDRKTAFETIKLIVKLGYSCQKKGE